MMMPDELMKNFIPSGHPDVCEGKRESEEVRREFLETFDVGGEVEGRVTRGEFESYYASVGACVQEDSRFESIL
eukprot:CAMPEP_0182425702 /NCGR_PEP_ID=MMETSP1167-20130531/12188_1 /TAXON_ID=2988 /ORGANISM="Mallomonas Sp, Strain CCMP3275" /LENGTH=73 /DNA_ID=CAMNT_0024606635 /DNA_START=122 /DNA_END=339 /DNA_ORIENTATION=-